jgi:dipeptidase
MTSKKFLVIGSALTLVFVLILVLRPGTSKESPDLTSSDFELGGSIGCTDIVVGKDASVDGSVITSHTGCAEDCRIHVVPAQTFNKGTMAPVCWGIQEVKRPLKDYGQVIGKIPQIKKTYAYLHSGYPHINEHQLAIAETTLSQKNELKAYYPVAKQIMTIEQAQLFALQRCKTAREALALITSLIEKYGFLPSCVADGEALCIADPNEAWVLEVFSVGNNWMPESGKPGAVWAAQRVPDDHVVIVPNASRIREIDLDNPDFKASENYIQVAVDHGWYEPVSGKSFIWQEAYAPPPTEGNMNRIWLFHKIFAPSLKKYHTFDPISYYPFSFKPEKKVSVQDVIAFQRSVFEGTIYDMTEDLDWLVSDGQGGFVKSPLTTPFPTRDMRELLDITWHRNVSQGGYGMVAQLRGWLPAPIGGVYWVYLDNQYVSTYVPIYVGVQEISPLYKTYDPDKFSEDSARWAIDFVDNLLYLKWQEADKDLLVVRDSLEADFFTMQAKIEAEALDLYRKDPNLAKKFLTDHTRLSMEKIVKLYRDLRYLLISKYTNNKQGTNSVYRGDDFEYGWPK